jgi:glutathione S-transferase
MNELTLYVDDHWCSPYAFSNFVSLNEKKLTFDVVELSLPKKETLKADYLERSLTGRLPTLRHGDYFLSESSAINEYLDDVFPPPGTPSLFPEDPKDRGRARQLMAWIRSDLMPIREERSTSTLFYDQQVKPLSAAGQEHAQRLLRVANALIAPSRDTLFGQWCIADADFALMLYRLVKHGHPVDAKVKRYVETNWQRPSVRKWVEKKRKEYVPY